MSELLAKLQGYAMDAVDARGVQVYLKTDLGPELQVYDSDAPQSTGQGLPIKYAVRITDRSGRQITAYGEPPATNPIKSAIAIALAGVAVFTILNGVARLMEKV